MQQGHLPVPCLVQAQGRMGRAGAPYGAEPTCSLRRRAEQLSHLLVPEPSGVRCEPGGPLAPLLSLRPRLVTTCSWQRAASREPGSRIAERERERVGGDCRHSVSEGSHVGEVWRPVPKNLLHICTMRITINDATSIIARIRLLCIRMLAMSSFRAVRKPEAPSRSAKKNEGSKI